VPQNVHGPNPSLTQITFPQVRQLGAAASSGCRVAMQLHARAALSVREGLVCTSRDRIALSSSVSDVLAPCMGVPPVIFTFVLCGAGEEVREFEALFEALFALDVLKSDINDPAADGGARGVGAGAGAWAIGWAAGFLDMAM
jgi:hypothetical protein